MMEKPPFMTRTQAELRTRLSDPLKRVEAFGYLAGLDGLQPDINPHWDRYLTELYETAWLHGSYERDRLEGNGR